MVFVPVSSMLSSLNQRRDSWDAILKTQNNSNEAGTSTIIINTIKVLVLSYSTTKLGKPLTALMELKISP